MEEAVPLMLRARGADVSVRRGVPGGHGRTTPIVKQKPVVLIDEEGHLSYTTLRKQALVTDMALRHRDIRALEPQVALPYPPAIMVRKQAIVLNLEGLKLIIGREKVLVLSVPAPHDLNARCPADLSSPIIQHLAAHVAMRAWPVGAEPGLGASFSVATLEELRGGAYLPYELRALEAALLCLVRVLNREVDALECATKPVLDRIRRGVVRSDLEELYESRTRLTRAVARVARLKEILEELLDEEELMAGLCLTAQETARSRAGDDAAADLAATALPGSAPAGGVPPSPPSPHDSHTRVPEPGPPQRTPSSPQPVSAPVHDHQTEESNGDWGGQGDGLDGRRYSGSAPAERGPLQGSLSVALGGGTGIHEADAGAAAHTSHTQGPARGSHGFLPTHGSHGLHGSLHPAQLSEGPDLEEVEECEDLVEAYWLQVDALLSRLLLLQERIAATEHLVNLDLDSRRNQLVSLGLAIDLLLMAFEAHMALTSIFGMNLESGLESLQPWSLWGIVTLGVIVGATLAVFVGRYARRNGLLFLPSVGLVGDGGQRVASGLRS